VSRTKKLQPLSNSLAGFLKSLGIESKVREYEVIGYWPSIVGEKIASASEAQYVSDGILFVKAKNSTWRNELIYMKGEILSRIDKKVGRGIINDIRYI